MEPDPLGPEASYTARLRRVFGTVFGNRDLRRVELAYIGFNAAEWATWIAMLVYAYGVGGATASGLVALIQLVPATVFAPFAAHLGDRYRRERVLFWGYLAQGVATSGTAVVLLVGAPVPVVYAFAAVSATLLTMTRPVQGALLPLLARTPQELTAANVVSGFIEGVSALIGPAVTGVLLQVSGATGPGIVYAVMAGLLLVSTLLAARIRTHDDRARRGPARDAGRFAGSMAGFVTLAREPGPRVLVGLGAAEFVLLGVLNVLTVVLALELLGIGSGGVGFLDAAFGAGGVLAGAATVLLVGRRRLGPPLLAGALASGVAFTVIGIVPNRIVAPLLLVAAGAGRSLADVAGRTLLQRVVDDAVLSRVFGVLEGLQMAALAIGSIAAPALVIWLGPQGAFIAAGAFLPVLSLITWPMLSKTDRRAAVAADRVSLLRGIPMFAPLSPPVLERLARHLVPVAVAAGTPIIRQGEAGDRFYVVASGEVTVSIDGRELRMQGPGGSFGEIALLRDVPRTAGVTARTDVRLFALEREPFLEAVTRHPQSLSSAHEVVDRRLRRAPGDPPLSS